MCYIQAVQLQIGQEATCLLGHISRGCMSAGLHQHEPWPPGMQPLLCCTAHMDSAPCCCTLCTPPPCTVATLPPLQCTCGWPLHPTAGWAMARWASTHTSNPPQQPHCIVPWCVPPTLLWVVPPCTEAGAGKESWGREGEPKDHSCSSSHRGRGSWVGGWTLSLS